MSRYFWPILTPPSPLSHFVTHPGTPQRYVTYLGLPHFIRPSTKNPDKSPCTNSLAIVRRGSCLEGFVRGGFCPFPLLSEYICYNRKLNITLNFMFHMYDKQFVSMMSHALDPLPLSHLLGPLPP